MQDFSVNECLSSVDSFFLYMERPGAPMNVASVSVFEGEIAFAECARYLSPRLRHAPRFLQRVVFPPIGIGIPVWQADPGFNLRNHLREVTLQRGTEAELKAAVSRILSTHLDRSRPLWDLTLIHGLEHHRTGVIVRTHHCVIDGVAGVGMLKVLLDENPVPAPVKRSRNVPPAPPREVGQANQLIDGFVASCFSAVQALLTAQAGMVQMAQRTAATQAAQWLGVTEAAKSPAPFSPSQQFGELGRFLSDLATPVERMPYNVLCHGPQDFEWVSVPMAEIVAVKQACSATVNDVVLTTITATLRRYAEQHKLAVGERNLRLVAPVNLRGVQEASDSGNHITFLPIDIPLGIKAPRKLLAAVQQKTALSRTGSGAELVGLVMTLLGAFPSPLQQLIGTILSQLPISLCNSICTNVHGPRTPLYLAGHKMLSSYPYVPIGGEMGMNCAVLSYNDSLFIAFTGDRRAIPDLKLLPGFFRESFAELKKSAGLGETTKEKTAKPPVRKAAAKASAKGARKRTAAREAPAPAPRRKRPVAAQPSAAVAAQQNLEEAGIVREPVSTVAVAAA